ncbi:MAG: hypothetical protein EOP54_23250 [Sphingobacteriales bacterium]|nr:MAG: hypothetical protein EOP54_23250 [Sphingobacteriales bacterium]
MKSFILLIAITFFVPLSSQVIIGDAVGTAPQGQKGSVLVEFALGQNKGIVLPYVRTLPSGAGLVGGTILLDATDETKAKIKYYNGMTNNGSNGWIDLSNGHEADITAQMVLQPSAATVAENLTAKAIIGSRSSEANGVLVLESASKAMILPTVADTNDIPDPAPGMMVYINKTSAKRLAVFNGEGWTYWKP